MPASSQPSPASIHTATALVATARELGSQQDAAGDPQQSTARTALHCLAAFGAEQVHLFGRGFGPEGALTPDPRVPGDFLLEVLVRQLTFDVDLLQRALGQRTPICSTAALRELLAKADRLAATALAPAVAAGLIEPFAPLTYLQKSPSVRLLPYAPVAVIGFDLAAVGDALRLVAIAHEAGHQVYRQLMAAEPQDFDAQIEAMAAAAPAPWPGWLLAWAEEIFADVYGTLIAGPVAGLALTKMLASALPAALVTDDGDHPLPALRPSGVVTVLRHLAGLAEDARQRRLLGNAANALELNWRRHLVTVGSPTAFTPVGAVEPLPLAEAEPLLAAFVASLLEDELASIAQGEAVQRWSEGLTTDDPAALPELTGQLSATLVRLADMTVPWLDLAAQGDQILVLPSTAGVSDDARAVGQTGLPLLDTLRAEAIAGQRKLAPDEWKAVFLAGGWVTEQGGSGITPPIFGRGKKPARRPTRPLRPGQGKAAG